MTPKQLRIHVERLSPDGPITRALEKSISGGIMKGVWYENQREHLLGWLAEYDGPGYYGRANWRRSAEFVYSHFQCAPGLLWLAEAAGAPRSTFMAAKKAVLAAPTKTSAQAGALRRVLPWSFVETLLKARE